MILEHLQFRCVGHNGAIHLTYDMFEMKLDNLYMICFKEIDTCRTRLEITSKTKVRCIAIIQQRWLCNKIDSR